MNAKDNPRETFEPSNASHLHPVGPVVTYTEQERDTIKAAIDLAAALNDISPAQIDEIAKAIVETMREKEKP